MPGSPSSLADVLDRIEQAAKGGKQVSFEDILDAVGRRSFGPLLVLAGLVILAPIVGDIPGMPTAVGIFVLLVTSQIVFGRKFIWLPDWMRRRSVKASKVTKATGKLRKPVEKVDGLFRKRLGGLVNGTVVRAIAGVCMVVSVIMPALELIPFSANAAGIVLLTFGVALVVRDGLMVIVGTIATVATLVIVGMALL